ncbi:MAG: TIGR00266 family protein [Clostridiales bacterium]|jgi:uncharacterized protein (TIGR00266 family)|nr:TIGR00266 family protein [Clostridiales bacterium]
MQYSIEGGNFPVAICQLNQGESMYCQRGAMAWMTPGVKMETSTGGGLAKGLARVFSGESIFVNTYTAESAGQSITFASSFAGQILPVDVGKCTIIAQKRAFLAAEPSVSMNVTFTKRLGAGFFGGEGFILQKFSGKGTALLEIDGSIVEKTLAPGEELLIDNGYLAAMEETVAFEIRTVAGIKNVVFGGEGLFLGYLRGPGKVWLQTMPMAVLAHEIASMLPSKG